MIQSSRWAGLRSWWISLPGDAKAGYITAGGFGLWFGGSVLLGPGLFSWAPVCILLPALAIVILVLAVGVAVRSCRLRRVMPLLIASACLASFWEFPVATVELYLASRIYLAGGPASVNRWAQEAIRKHIETGEHNSHLESTQIPWGVRTFLPGFTTVGGTIWSDVPRLRIEQGGGFFHYGIVIYSSEFSPPQEWWQHLMGWPPEIVVYSED